ncbi:hypothetical protein [Stenotrophomonas virus Jojan60]|nr:hypothetical protein [Stenotrophomonas virus Jojan60]
MAGYEMVEHLRFVYWYVDTNGRLAHSQAFGLPARPCCTN